MADFRRIADVKDIPDGKRAIVEILGKKIVIFNVAGDFYAVDNTCTHRGGPLGEGALRGTALYCPWHGSHFDVTSGRVLGPPASTSITSYATKVEDGGVWVALS
jgi:nitrite reductase (NADH) small subunit/3-phenylpropionate/trans-cinnamate dioxygenase ferredoxin subunit